MRTRTMLLLTLAFCLFAVAVSLAQNPNLGTWKLDESKSDIPAGAGKNLTVVYTADGDNYKAVINGVDGNGNPTHNEWIGKFDGKDYPVTGDPNFDTRAIQQVSEGHYKLTGKKGGETVLTGTVDTSPDGKTRTVKTTYTAADGKEITSTAVYEKQ
jgi:hypothetical protein